VDVLEILEALQALTPLASYRSETGPSCLAATNSPMSVEQVVGK